MKFRTTMWSLPAMAGVLLGLGLCVATVQGWKTNSQLDALQNASFPYLERVLRVDRAVTDLRAALQAAALEDNADKLEEAKAPALAAETALKESAQLAGHADRAAKLASAFGNYRDAATAVTRSMLDKKPDAALPKQMASALATLSALLKSEEVSARADVQSGFQSVGESRSLSQWSGVGVTVVALLALGLAARFIVASVWRQLGGEPESLRLTVERVAAGDLQVRIPVEKGDHHSLNAAVAAMAERLRQTVQQIRSASDTISTASGEIAAGNQDLSNRTENTASNLQQAASQLESIANMASNGADSARQANELSGAASEAARLGSEIVTAVVNNMSDITSASKKITDIIGVIDGIAFQTNILALNAAVEAARAGEQGRGFAVVAGEVRTLAQRSAQAAREIKTLIQSSGEKVESGSKLVSNAGQAMQEIMASVDRASHIIGDINASMTEQSAGIGQVNGAVSELEQMTQQNAALVEQSAAAAESMRMRADELVSAVSAFKLA